MHKLPSTKKLFQFTSWKTRHFVLRPIAPPWAEDTFQAALALSQTSADISPANKHSINALLSPFLGSFGSSLHSDGSTLSMTSHQRSGSIFGMHKQTLSQMRTKASLNDGRYYALEYYKVCLMLLSFSALIFFGFPLTF